MHRLLRVCLLLFALVASACITPSTDILVRITSDLGTEVTAVRIDVSRVNHLDAAGVPDNVERYYNHVFTLADAGEQIGTFGISPHDPDDVRAVDVKVTATLRSSSPIVREFVTHFEPRKTLLLDVFFTRRCTGPNAPSCPAGTTCGATGCESIARPMLPEADPNHLPDASVAAPGDGSVNTTHDATDAIAHLADATDATDATVVSVPDVMATVPDVVAPVPDVIAPPPDVVTVVPDVIAPLPDVVSVPPDVVTGPIDLAPPRPVWPLSGSRVTTRRPSVRWVLASGSDGARVEFCRTRSCATVAFAVDASGSTAAPPADLDRGAWFWRLRARAGNTPGLRYSPVWELFTGARTAPVATVSGIVFDADGDGHADVASGAPQSGTVAVLFGSATGTPPFGSSVTLTGLVTGAGTGFGTAVSPAGDIDGDGYGDLVVGAPQSLMVGDVYVFYGAPGGSFRASPSRITGTSRGIGFGGAVTTLGDANGDGYGDLAVGTLATGKGETGTSALQVSLYFGSASGLASTSTPTYVINPPATVTGFGSVLAGGGDLDGDGLGDLLVGTPVYDGNTGRVYTVLGRASGAPVISPTVLVPPVRGIQFGAALSLAGDVDGDGYADAFVGAPAAGPGGAGLFRGSSSGLVTTAAATLIGTVDESGFGTSLSDGGDLDGDGYADLAVGAPGGGHGARGTVFVFYGAPGTTPVRSGTTTTRTPTGGTQFGTACTIDDIDGDGYADLVVGAPGGGGGIDTGAVYVLTGSSTGIAALGAPRTGATGTMGFGRAVASVWGRACAAGPG